MRVVYNGEVHTFAYALPGATVDDVVQALCGRLQIAMPWTEMGLFTGAGVQLDPGASVSADDGRELILRPTVLH